MSRTSRASSSATPVAALGALGVVFGDIGTSPLYALRSVLGEGEDLSAGTVYGLTSLVVWALIVVVSVLYVGLLLRTDNAGEGGILALVALLRRTTRSTRVAAAATVLGMAGAAMFLGDCVITPAVSVLSAAEGLEEASPSLHVVVLPFAVVVLIGVFWLQRLGSGVIGRVYGPVMVVWFLLLGLTGAVALAQHPGALVALSPWEAIRFAAADPLTAFLSLGSVVLVVTGAEALYADLGHFGRRAITSAWLVPVLPALVLAYLGEAGAAVGDPQVAADPFFALVPGWATIPVLVVATAATVIASEAVIAGAFTVLHQAAGLGFLPSLRTQHPSERHAGQIYVPAANWALMVAVLAMVVGFGSSARLSQAYGVAVTSTITVTAVLYVAVQRAGRGTHRARQVVAAGCLLVVLLLLAATVPKIPAGGWAPVGIGVVLLVLMTTWRTGRHRLAVARRAAEGSPAELLADVGARDLRRVPGTAVFLTREAEVAPLALRTVVEVAGSLPEHVVLLSWHVEDTPRADPHAATVRLDRFEDCYDGVLGVDVALGYRERLDVEHVLRRAAEHEHSSFEGADLEDAYFVVSDARPRLHHDPRMGRWRQRLFLLLDRVTTDPVDQIGLPRSRTVTVGRDLEL